MRVLCSLLLLVGMAAGQAPAVKPALWKVKGVHGTVYLFGTVHAMKAGVPWETAPVKRALDASDTVYLEIADMDDAAMKAMAPQVMAMGMDAEHPLSSKISAEDKTMLAKVATEAGLPDGEATFEPMKPWLAYMMVSVLPTMKAGYDPANGIDKTVQAQAVEAKKKVVGFETVTEQLGYLAGFPEKEQVELLHKALLDAPNGLAELDAIMGDWERGDVEKIGSVENDEMKATYPELYDRLLLKRNARFAGTLAGVLKDPATGTVFVAIGAGHLAGPDSVEGMLSKKGFAVERVQ